MNFEYKTRTSYGEPLKIDDTSSPTTVYLRKNITSKKEYEPASQKEIDIYTYEEARISKEQYNNYLVEKAQADLEFLYMMTGVDYDE